MVPNAAVPLLEHLPAQCATELLARLDARAKRDFLASAPLSVPVTDLVVEHGGQADHLALVGNAGVPADRVGRLLDLGDPEVALAVYRSFRVSRHLQQRVAAMLPPERLFPVVDPEYRRNPDVNQALYPLVESRDPDVVTAAVAGLVPGVMLPGARTAVLRGYASLHETAGPRAVRRLVRAHPELTPGRDDVPLVVWRAFKAPDDPDAVAVALAHLGSTEHLADRIELVNGWRDVVLLLLAPREPLDWTVLRERLYPAKRSHYAWLLAREPDCPPDFRPRPPRALLLEPRRLAVLDARPAAEALADLVTSAGAVRDAAATEIGDVVRATLSDRTEAWIVALRLLEDFQGSVRELLHTASAATA
ncbi:hypothetical protein [Yinghuangia seranimata]|uniref:hypothetical protein n=1 Tax=Yinghuangia seranimata TaxID=408067 RepID=UPI00248CA9D7|nr:hypothetical protein [Yinghuangia seranimata]MDI2129066.1 hypothetical protein [Yinghuangia seranimata]